MTLLASLLMERRIIMVCRSKDTLSAAIHAASAMIYPFEWPHRFYLPIMPETMRDYLQAPFPFLVGLPAELMDFTGLEMDEVTLIDLDLGTCRPEPGSPADDAFVLPKRAKLEQALHQAVKSLRSPTEFEGNTIFSELFTTYMVRLFKHYRDHVSKKPLVQVLERGCFGPDRRLRRHSNNNISFPDFEESSTIDDHGYRFDHSKFVASRRYNRLSRNGNQTGMFVF